MASGLVLIDKPKGWTSHDVVAKMRGIAGTRRVGHAGTLDPMATGLLLLGINAGTKLLTFLVGATKTYEATIRLGASTITDDAEGEVTSTADGSAVDALTLEKIESALKALRGEIMQVPSSVSAIKVDGERAYAKVRGGDEVKLAARPITVSRFEITSALQRVSVGDSTFIDFEAVIECSSGTYIRALARDLGSALQVGGHLTALRRTRIGTYKIENAQQLDGLSSNSLSITSMFDAVKESFELRELSEQEVVDLRHGKRVSANDCVGKEIAGVNGQRLIAMLEKADSQLKSSVVFVEDSHD
ncbi:MAG: tRNA pseudouridine(55) synthase TruB [Rhodoluna sp.]|nr:tRNA pseudouridine(55) synthase TruB [Rhodoluna sp.]